MNDPARRGCGACRRYFRPAARRNLLAFWLLGLLNNAGYVVMNAGAKEITPCLVGLVYVANVVPSFCTKLSLPFWQHRVGYRTRLAGATALMAASFLVVVAGNVAGSPGVELLGVALGSLQSGLGEASVLAMAGLYDSRRALTAWSSGTGVAGIFGYAYVILFTQGFRASFPVTLLCGLAIPVGYALAFFRLLGPPSEVSAAAAGRLEVGGGGNRFMALQEEDDEADEADEAERPEAMSGVQEEGEEAVAGGAVVGADARDTLAAASPGSPGSSSSSAAAAAGSALPATFRERVAAVRSLWIYMVPLFLVYFAECECGGVFLVCAVCGFCRMLWLTLFSLSF